MRYKNNLSCVMKSLLNRSVCEFYINDIDLSIYSHHELMLNAFEMAKFYFLFKSYHCL